MTWDGSAGPTRAADAVAARLPGPLRGLATLAYNYRWSWTGGGDLFRSLDAHRWERSGGNPVRLLEELSPGVLETAAADPRLVEAVGSAVAGLEAHLAAAPPAAAPVAFLCAEFGIHPSLPIYSGGLGVLAGDVLREASDRGLAMVGVGLLYRHGYFHQRIDRSGWQHESWSEVDPENLPVELVTGPDGGPLTVSVPLPGREVRLQVWRVAVGRVPLLLLDADVEANALTDRWITRRLYVSDREIRLAQYALLGRGGIRALRALGIEPSTVHLNEGHASLATLELAAIAAGNGRDANEALAAARRRCVFTTHTPVAAGNEAFDATQVTPHLEDLAAGLGVAVDDLLELGRIHPSDASEPFGVTPLGIRMSRSTNAVSRRHGEVAREMWHGMFPGRPVEEVAVGYVTNGVHLPTWMARPMADLLDSRLPADWRDRADDPQTWRHLERVTDGELWRTRCRLRADLVDHVRERSVLDRLDRGEDMAYVREAADHFDADTLTIGFARRLATYKRLSLIVRDLERARRLLSGDRPVQIVIAGKAHPQDDEAKRIVQLLFEQRRTSTGTSDMGAHVVFLQDYDMAMAARLVAGCDVWINVPRPPLEASGTSGMKAVFNGCLNLSVADGWWAEAWDGGNGWSIPAPTRAEDVRDDVDAAALYDLLEGTVVPLFHDRDGDGVPRRWLERVRASMSTLAPRFCATRMLRDYERRVYGPAVAPVR